MTNSAWIFILTAMWAVAATLGILLMSRRIKILRSRIRTQEAELKRRTEQNHEMENEFNSVFYSMSHDLRAPLRSVHGFSQIILRNYKAKLDGDGRQFLHIIESNASLMNQMIEDILVYSRLARREMSFSEIDMTRMVERITGEIRKMVPERQIQFEIRPLPKVRGDQTMIRQVWAHLIHNAVKFTRGRSSAAIQIDGHSEPEQNVYLVRDNGIGFDMHYANKLFGMFQRLHSVEEFEGTGAGLAAVKRIISRHGGKVWVESKSDAGSVFYFSLLRG